MSIDEAGRVTNFNHEAESIFGYTAAEICGRNLDCLIPKNKRAAHSGQVTRFLEGESRSMPMSNWRQVSGVHKTGRLIPLQVVVAQAKVNGERLATAIIRDMTEIADRDRRLEDLSVENALNAKLAKAASRARRDFMAVMSHELRTPLNAIIGFSDLLLSNFAASLPDKSKNDYISDINASGKQLLSLINGILELTRIESGRMELKTERVGVLWVITESTSSFVSQIEEKKLTVELSNVDQELAIIADTEGVRQALTQILSNAIKFSHPGGHITITCGESGKCDMLSIQVADQGIGIAKHDIPRLCRPFTQVEGPMVRANGGAGVGLAIANSLTKAMGGELSIDSDVGVGTVVTLALPRAGESDPESLSVSPTRNEAWRPL